ncbi:MAG: beta strand repeat-containing protein, partial [Gemmataceae bacterium]
MRSISTRRDTTVRRPARHSARPRVERLEERDVPATLPAPVVTGGATLQPLPGTVDVVNGNARPYTGAKIMVNPVSPSQVVAVASYNPSTPSATDASQFPGLRIWASSDSGTTWSTPITVNNFLDPTDFSNNQIFLAQNEDASLAWDRLNNFYVASSQHNVANTSGAITLHKFAFSGGTPTQVDLDPATAGVDPYVFYRWTNQDPAFNPVVAIDTNTPSFTDPDTGHVQTDTLANNVLDGGGNLVPKAIYVAWNTNFTRPQNSDPATLSRIWTAVSGDGGQNFTTNQFVSGPAIPSIEPQIVFTQGTPDAVGAIGTLQLTNPGTGYDPLTPPTVTINGSGTGATAVAAVSVGVNQVSVTNGGSGNTAIPTVTQTGGGGTGATAVASLTTGVITSINLFNGGTGFLVPPLITFTGTGTGATAVATVVGGVVTAITITNGGSGYTGLTNINFIGGGGTGAFAFGNASGVVTGVTVTNRGTGYTSAPTVTFVGGGGTGAAATAAITGYVSSVALTNQGTGYGSTPTTVTFSGPGTGAAAVTTLENNARIAGGRVIFVWSGSSSNAPGQVVFNKIFLDSSSPDGGVADGRAATAQLVSSGPLGRGTGTFGDAFVPGTTPPNNVAVTTRFTLPVTITDPGFTTLTDLNVRLNLRAPNLEQLRIEIVSPSGQRVALVNSARNPVDGATINNTGITGANLGTTIGGATIGGIANFFTQNIGTVFDDQAVRSIRDATTAAPYHGHFRSENTGILGTFNGLTKAQIDGNWTLEITDTIDNGTDPVDQFVNEWALHFTGAVSTTGFGPDTILPVLFTDTSDVAMTTVRGSATNVNPLVNTATGAAGIGPGIAVTVDNTLGSFSPHQGTVYVAFNGYRTRAALVADANDTDIIMLRSTNGGASFSPIASVVNQDAVVGDNFSEGNRPQFNASLTVDPVTGTLLASYFDARYDAARARVSTTLGASIDGGLTFSETYLNQVKQATDAITRDVHDLESVPGNQSQAGALGFGGRQGLSAFGGRVFAAFSS